MYNNIEKAYRRIDPYKFNKLYFFVSIILAPIFYIILRHINNKWWYWITYIIMFILIFIIFYMYLSIKLKRTLKTNYKICDIYENIKSFSSLMNKQRRKDLLSIMLDYDFNTKDDIKLAIEHYNKEKPIFTKPNYLEWIISLSLGLGTFFSMAYTDKGIIDYEKFITILEPTITFILVIIMIVIIPKFILYQFKTNKIQLISDIEEDLTIIFLNFEKMKINSK